MSKDKVFTLNIVSTIDALVNEITDLIFNFEYKPGDQITELELVERFDVSRHSIRQAFTVLISKGILVKEPNRGVFIPVLTLEDIEEIYNTRLLFEKEAARTLAQREFVSKKLYEAVNRLESITQTDNWSEYIDADVNFHKELIEAVGNKRLSRLYENIIIELKLCICQSKPHAYPLDLNKKRHREMLKAIEDKNVVKAEEIIQKHIEEGLKMFRITMENIINEENIKMVQST